MNSETNIAEISAVSLTAERYIIDTDSISAIRRSIEAREKNGKNPPKYN